MDRNDSIVQQTGAKLRHFRLRKGISQEQLALDCDLNINTIGMIERGQKNPTIFTLQRICDGLGITLATLFLYEGDTAPPKSRPSSISRLCCVNCRRAIWNGWPEF